MSKFSQKGVSLYLAVMIMVIFLAVVLGMTTILFGQIKTIRRIGYSVIALYAADTGIERELKIIFKDNNPPEANYSEFLDLDSDGGGLANGCPDGLVDDDDACYKVESVCCVPGIGDCSLDVGDCPGLSEESSCNASYYCIRSTGNFKETKRAIEVGI